MLAFISSHSRSTEPLSLPGYWSDQEDSAFTLSSALRRKKTVKPRAEILVNEFHFSDNLDISNEQLKAITSS